MHETAIIEGLLRILDRQARVHGIRRVTRVRLKVGRLRAVEPEQLKSGFVIFSEGSIAEGAELLIEVIPVRARCRACGAESEITHFRFECAQCGSKDLEILAGQELFIESFDGDDGPNDKAATPQPPIREKPSLLSLLAQPELSAFAESFTRHRLAEGELIYDSRLTGHDAVFVVVTGQLRVFLSSEGKEFTLFFLERDDLFTFHSGAVLEARKPTEILAVDVGTFERILSAVPSLALTVIPLMEQTLRNTVRIVEDLSLRDVRQRLMRLLCDKADSAGRWMAEGVVIETDMHAEDFAMMVGTTRQSVSTIFTDLDRTGLIRRPSRKQVVIPDLARLKREVQSF